MNIQKRDIKILVSADCRGRLEELVAKVTALHQKTNFDLMILTGEVCHPRASSFMQAVRSQTLNIPLPIYFIDESEMSPVLHTLHPHGLQICKNFTFLGSHGIIKLKETTIAYFSHNGNWQDKAPSKEELQNFINMCKGRKIDILLTNRWASQIKIIADKPNAKSSDYVSLLASALNPHYHLAAGGDSFYRMSPYANSNQCLTHFISVAPYEQNTKDKYIFGLTLKPGWQQLASGSNFLQNPYTILIEQQKLQQNDEMKTTLKGRINDKRKEVQSSGNNPGEYLIYFENFPDWARNSDITQFLQRWGDLKTIECKKQLVKGSRCGYVKYRQPSSMQSCLQSSEKVLFHSKRIKFSKKALEERKRHDDCWFCKQKGDTSLIIYEGKYCYISLQKGPINKFHMQIIPYNHVETTGKLEMAEREQLDHVLTIIKNHFISIKYEVIVYERYLPLSEAINHCVLHLIPMPLNQQNNYLLESKFQKLNVSDHLGFRLERGERRNNQHFIKISFNSKIFIKEINKKDRVQADYMRVILAQLMDNAKLANWKQCIRSQEQLLKERRDILGQLKQAGLLQ